MSACTPFSFSTVAHIICAAGASRQLGRLLRQRYRNITRVLLVSDAAFLSTGLADAALADLRAHEFIVDIFDEVVADPPDTVVLQAHALARQQKSELIIGFGGGSSMDVAKLVAALASGQALAAMYGIDQLSGARLPLVQIPTTAGTGSEATAIAIVTTGSDRKMAVVAPQLYADLAILDAGLTLDLPPLITAATAIDAMVHAIEAYTTRLRKNPLSDMLACRALSLLSAHFRTACSPQRTLDTRQNMALGALLAGQAFANAPCAAVHALAYPIGALFHVAHGISNAVVLPHVLRFNSSHAAPLYAELAAIVAPGAGGSALARSEALIGAMQQMIADTGLPTRLRELNIARDDIERLATDAMQQTRLLGNNPRPLAHGDAVAIYSAAW